MRYILFILLIANGRLAYTQSNSCNCIVKLIAYNLDEALQDVDYKDQRIFTYGNLPDNIKSIPKISSYYISKDSLNTLFISPIENGIRRNKIIVLKKLERAFTLNINFNNLDSIAIYSEPKKSAKILTYLKKEKKALTTNEKSLGYELNDHWFSGCKTGWVKIRVYDRDKKKKTKVIGWVNIERK
jgi:hypothetical protein